MFGKLGAPELILILGIVILIFGVGRLGRIGSEMGSAIKNFREGLGTGTTTPTKDDEKKDVVAAESKPQDKA